MVTQAPLDNTVLDFWKMAKNLESRTIVLLCDLTENGKVYTQKHFTDNSVLNLLFTQLMWLMFLECNIICL